MKIKSITDGSVIYYEYVEVEKDGKQALITAEIITKNGYIEDIKITNINGNVRLKKEEIRKIENTLLKYMTGED